MRRDAGPPGRSRNGIAVSSTLYLIATPIGNREDITRRAVETLRRASFVIAEDTREARKLLDLLGIGPEGKRFVSYGSHNEHRGVESLVAAVVATAESALVTDRGTPGISDPGSEIVDGARRAGVRIVPVPGPSSLTAALSVSGFPSDRFLFLGFLPRSGTPRAETWDLVTRVGGTVAFFESPKRVRETAVELRERFPEAEVFFARELTKLHESLTWTTGAALEPESLPELGEYVVVLRVAPPGAPAAEAVESAVKKVVAERLLGDKAWAKAVAPALGVPAKAVYDELQRARRTATAENRE
jgi:16S rRNA (cytidine1402-2'-O)-methyltransferase